MRGFTFIEMMISITIITLIFFSAYIPYDFYQKKTRIKIASRELSQSFYDAKNLAISGIKDGKNLSVAIYLDADLNSKNNGSIIFYTFPFDKGASINKGDLTFLKEKKLQPGVKILNIGSKLDDSHYIIFESINGNISILDKSLSPTLKKTLDIKLGIAGGIYKNIKYLKQTNIVDYE